MTTFTINKEDSILSVLEGQTSGNTLQFAIQADAPVTTKTIVSYQIASGTADQGEDFSGNNGSVTFLPGDSEKMVSIDTIPDITPESDEYFTLHLNGAVGGGGNEVDRTQVKGVIQHDDHSEITIVDPKPIEEGDAGYKKFNIEVKLSAPTDQDIDVVYATHDGTATANKDYTATGGTVTIKEGHDSTLIPIGIIGDKIHEEDETFGLEIQAAYGANILKEDAVIIIKDNEPPPPTPVSVSIDDAITIEGNRGVHTVKLKVTLDTSVTEKTTLHWATTGDLPDSYSSLATVREDYLQRSGNLVFNKGQQVQSISLKVKGDTLSEGNEVFGVVLSNPKQGGLIFEDDLGIVTIQNDDKVPALEPVITITPGNHLIQEGDSGKTAVHFTVALDHASDQPVTVVAATLDGSASIADEDYDSKTQLLTFAAGETQKEFTININGDTRVEDDENFAVQLSDPTGATPHETQSRAIVTIQNDDSLNAIMIISVNTIGHEAQGTSWNSRFSPDGTKVLFISTASNLVPDDTNGKADLFIKDLATEAVMRVSTATDGAQANNAIVNAAFSSDGQSVFFKTSATNLIADDTNGIADWFAKDLSTGVTRLMDTAPSITYPDLARGIDSPDQRYRLFYSDSDSFVSGDTNHEGDLFIQDEQSQVIMRVNISAAGAEANDSTEAWAQFSPDGQSILFESFASNLVPDDTNHLQDIFIAPNPFFVL